MNHNLYFIPILMKALDSSDVERALRQAFRTIRRLGRLPGYKDGYEQFHLFMKEAARACAAKDQELRAAAALVDSLIIAIATDTFPGTDQDKAALLERIRSRPDWQAKFEHIRSDIQPELNTLPPIEITVSRDGVEIEVIAFTHVGETHRVQRIMPGRYVLSLSTGRVLWRGDLGTQDVEWGAAFPEYPVDLAADSDGARGLFTCSFELLSGAITLRIYPGIEAGTLEISWKG